MEKNKQLIKQKMKELVSSYTKILIGLILYTVGYTCLLLPYQITSGGVSGISALIFYATGFQAQYSYLIINCALLLMALRIMGWSYFTRTIIATLLASFFIGVIQEFITLPDGTLYKCLGEERFMACVIGGGLEGLGLAIVFLAGGSTGGTDIIASCVNKFKDISLGRVMLYADILIIGCSYFLFHSVETLVIGYLTMFISMMLLDFIINGARQSVQLIIISNQCDLIANEVGNKIGRGVTILYGEGWYSKEQRRVLLILARKHESRRLFDLIHELDHQAFVSMCNVEGVFGEGFDKLKK